MARKPRRSGQSGGEESAALRALRESAGQSTRPMGWRVDGSLLAVAVQLLSRAGAAIQVGTSMDRAQLTFKVFDQGFPVTLRAEDEDSANEMLRRIALAYCPPGEDWDELRAWVERYDA